MERQLSQRTVEQIDRQLEFMQMEQCDIMTGRGADRQNDDYPGLKDFDGFQELNADGDNVVLEEVIVTEPSSVPIEEDPNTLGFKSENLVEYFELVPSEHSGVPSERESDPEYVPVGGQKNGGRKRKATKTESSVRPAKAQKSYQPKYNTEQSKPGPKSKVPDSALTPEELARRIQRRARNREAANRQRDKRNKIQNDLETKVDSLVEENSELKRENSSLRKELEKLRQQIQSQPTSNSFHLQSNTNQQVVYSQQASNNGMNGQLVLQLAPIPTQAAGKPILTKNSTFKGMDSTSSSARSTPNSVSTINSSDQNQFQAAGGQVFNGPLPSPFTQVLLMSPSMQAIPTQFQFPINATGANIDPPKVQAATFQTTVGNL